MSSESDQTQRQMLPRFLTILILKCSKIKEKLCSMAKKAVLFGKTLNNIFQQAFHFNFKQECSCQKSTIALLLKCSISMLHEIAQTSIGAGQK